MSPIPFLSVANRLLRRKKDLAAAAVQTSVLQPEEFEDCPAPTFLEGELAKVTASVPGHTSLTDELWRTTDRRTRHAPLIRYTLENCLVHPYGFDYRAGALRTARIASHGYMFARPEPLPEASYCMNRVSHEFFGHWLMDACPTALLAKSPEPFILDIRSDWPNAAEYAEVLGLHPESAGVKIVKRLHVYQDHGLGSHKRGRFAEMRARMAAKFGDTPLAARPVYLRRGGTGVTRQIANEEAVIEALQRQGFEIFDVAGASVEAAYRRFRNANLVISVDGSHLNHLYLAMAPGTALLKLVPSDRFTMIHALRSRAFGLNFGFLVMTPDQGGYQVDIARLLKTVEMMQR